MTPFQFVQYVALEQLDSLAVDGSSRALAGFARIAEEAEEYGNKMFESYVQSVGEGDPGDFADAARDQAVQYYVLLSNLRQGIVNLFAAGLYHLYEQHRDKLKLILKDSGRSLPPLVGLDGWAKVDELRLLANTVKHADGPSAQDLRKIRPDLFVPPIIKGSPLEKHALRRATENPLGGTDLFVTDADLQKYRDAIRQLWESLRPLLG